MPQAFLLDPEGVGARLRARYRNQRRHWLTGAGAWPLRAPLGIPNERQAIDRQQEVQSWQETWAKWHGPGEVVWVERRWPVLGTQRLPETLRFASPAAVAAMIGDGESWARAHARLGALSAIWPGLSTVLPGHFDVLSEWPDAELQRLVALLHWLVEHPGSDLYIRQLPIPGVDSKWLQSHQKVVTDGLRAILEVADNGDLYALTGLRRIPLLLRLRLLDPALRRCVGGLGDIQAPLPELAALRLPVARVLIIENLQTGLALEDLPGTVAFMGQGYAVEPLRELSWLRDTPCDYWGDIDTHGLVILDRLRTIVPAARSILMDEEALLAHRELWSHEAQPAALQELPNLRAAEQALFQALQANRWGPGVRLEQERLPWPYVRERIDPRPMS